MGDPRTLDELCARLGALRTAAGSPSYADIAGRIGELRGGDAPAKVTVYDCFRPGRRRVDERLVAEIASALGADDAEHWRSLARRLNGERGGTHLDVVLAPRTPVALVGRDELLERIPPTGVVILSGLLGVGKSALATRIAGTGTVLTADLRESEPGHPAAGPVEVLRRLLGALGHRSLPYDLTRLRRLFAREAAGLTVVIEDATSSSRLASVLVPGVRYVITTRGDLSGVRAQPTAASLTISIVPVDPLSPADTAELLRRRIGRRAGSRPVADEAVRRMAAVADGLPLDAVMIASVVTEHADWELDDLAARFESEPRDARVRAVLDAAMATLGPAEAELMTTAGLIDREFDAALLTEVAGSAGARAFERLRARHLFEVADGQVAMHAIVFAFVRERSLTRTPASRREDTVSRLVDAVLARIGDDDAYAARSIRTVLAVSTAARDHGLASACERIALAAHPALAGWSLWSESLRLHDLAVGTDRLAAGQELGLNIAHCAEKLGRYDEALAVLHRIRRVATGSALARSWNQIGNIERWMSHFADALSSYERALEIARDAGDPVVEGRVLGNHADTLRLSARYREAEEEYAQALEVSRSAGDRVNIEIVRSNRPLLLASMGRLDEAESEMLAVLRDGGDRPLPNARATLAQIAELRGDDDDALHWIAQAVQALAGDDEYGLLIELDSLRATIEARRGRIDAASARATDAVRRAAAVGSPVLSTHASNALATVLLAAGDAGDRKHLDAAEHQAREAIGIAEATGDVAEAAHGNALLAEAARIRGRRSDADAFAAEAEALYRRIGHGRASASLPAGG